MSIKDTGLTRGQCKLTISFILFCVCVNGGVYACLQDGEFSPGCSLSVGRVNLLNRVWICTNVRGSMSLGNKCAIVCFNVSIVGTYYIYMYYNVLPNKLTHSHT